MVEIKTESSLGKGAILYMYKDVEDLFHYVIATAAHVIGREALSDIVFKKKVLQVEILYDGLNEQPDTLYSGPIDGKRFHLRVDYSLASVRSNPQDLTFLDIASPKKLRIVKKFVPRGWHFNEGASVSSIYAPSPIGSLNANSTSLVDTFTFSLDQGIEHPEYLESGYSGSFICNDNGILGMYIKDRKWSRFYVLSIFYIKNCLEDYLGNKAKYKISNWYSIDLDPSKSLIVNRSLYQGYFRIMDSGLKIYAKEINRYDGSATFVISEEGENKLGDRTNIIDLQVGDEETFRFKKQRIKLILRHINGRLAPRKIAYFTLRYLQ